ncbi:related to HOL1, putative substrate-H+ antiporter [Rhynchosporium secalis]|uniref:Related to HOL1, putative substrate-H+ antiporter n=1 Tax=Rhynchosporium secalis TaxID=38038 RepID=A0A1E1M0E0_RHYSE|nr:related to HOL1, putative substrate-H+ antiporter [Rhynchosporium secalis]
MSSQIQHGTVEDVEMVPGTIKIIDLLHTMNVKHMEGNKSDIVLVPQPSRDPHDPLNWSRWRKEYHYWLLWWWGFIAAVSVNWVGPVWTQLTIDYNTSYFQLNVASALCWLFLGLGCVFLQPTAMKIGRRPVYLMATIFNLVGCVMGGLSKSIGLFFGVNILTGIGAAPVDSLVEISTMDIFFAHERGTHLSLLLFTIYAGSYLGPAAAGYVAESQTWRWCYWYLVIFLFVLLVLQLFTMEESTYRRPITSVEVGEMPASSHVRIKEVEAGQHKQAETTIIADEHEMPIPPIRTYLQLISLFQTSQNDPRSWIVIALRPFALITYPAVMWAGVVYGVQVMWLSLLATTQSEIFSSSPYNFSIIDVGNINFAAFIGGTLGMLWGGKVSDKCLLYLARRNGGIAEPEMRLWTMLLPCIMNSGGLLMYGLGSFYEMHWILSAGFGTACIAFGIGSGGAIAITYAVDCYSLVASEALVLMLFVRNMFGMGFTFVIQPWLSAGGLKNTSIIMSTICLVSNLSFLVMVWFGKRMRKWTAGRYSRAAGGLQT